MPDRCRQLLQELRARHSLGCLLSRTTLGHATCLGFRAVWSAAFGRRSPVHSLFQLPTMRHTRSVNINSRFGNPSHCRLFVGAFVVR